MEKIGAKLARGACVPTLNGIRCDLLKAHPRSGARNQGFTLIEMLAVVGIVFVLAALLLGAVHVGSRKVRGASCINNLRQMQVSWQLYTEDFQDRVPLNQSYQIEGIWRSTPDSWIGNSSAPYDKDTRAIENGLMFKYDYNRSITSYHCPADDSTVQKSDIQRTRSYSMNGAFGGNVDPNKKAEVDSNILQSGQVRQTSRTLVFIDEDEDSIDDGHFRVWFSPDNRWVNMPTDRHDKAAGASFVDGHAELLRWRWKKSFKKRQQYYKVAENQSDISDLRKLQKIAYPDFGAE
jgi:prepilin-type N-terminal cleavage/methylation domain-containing protein/prepilin-type processing-associated H-X9-DG protein